MVRRQYPIPEMKFVTKFYYYYELAIHDDQQMKIAMMAQYLRQAVCRFSWKPK